MQGRSASTSATGWKLKDADGGPSNPARGQVSDLGDLTDDQQRHIRDQILGETRKPLSVAIMGQTGVGKSSLLNALFGTNLEVSDIRPCTKVPEPVTVHGSSGHPIVFWDMPGIGESETADQHYLQLYRRKLIHCDVVLWAVHADTRSTLLDAAALTAIVRSGAPDEQRALIAKISFVLTKADLLAPPAWIYVRNGPSGTFVPSRTIRDRIDEKARYYQEVLVGRFGGLASTSTHHSDGFHIDDPRFSADEYRIRYDGFMTEQECDSYSRVYPQFAAVFSRLCDNQRVIPCSSLFRHNLVPLLVAIVNKLGGGAIGRFQQLVDGSGVTTDVPVTNMAQYCNIVVWDKREGRKTFDLSELF